MLVTTAGGGSEFISAHALQPGWRIKLGEPHRGESQNHSDEKYLQTCSPATAKGGLGPGRESISKRQGWGKAPAGAEGRALLMLEKGKQLSQTSQGSRVCVRQQARDSPAQGEGLNCLQDSHKTVLSIAHFSLKKMFRVLSEEASLSFLLCFFLLFSVDKTEIPEPAFVLLVMVLFSDFLTTRCPRKSQAGFAKHFPQTWHPASLAHISPKDLVPVAQQFCP